MKKSMLLIKLHTMKSEIELIIKHLEDEAVIEAQEKRAKLEPKYSKSSHKVWTTEEDDIIIKAANNKIIDIDDIFQEFSQERTIDSIRARVYVLGMRIHRNRILTAPKGLKL